MIIKLVGNDSKRYYSIEVSFFYGLWLISKLIFLWPFSALLHKPLLLFLAFSTIKNKVYDN